MNRLTMTALVTVLALVPAASLAQDVNSTVKGTVDSTTSAAVGVGGTSATVDANASASADANAAANSSSASTATDAQAGASASGSLTFEGLLTNLKSPDAAATVAVIAAVAADSTITIVPVSSIEGAASADATALATAETTGSDRLAKIRAAVHANAAIEAKLTAEGYSDSDVLDVESNGSGAVWVYVKDKS